MMRKSCCRGLYCIACKKKSIVPLLSNFSHLKALLCHAEPEAVDLLLETEKLEWLVQHTDEKNYARTCLYLTSCTAYLPEDDDSKVMQTAYQIYTKEKQYPDAMKVALMMNDQVMLSLCSNTFLTLQRTACRLSPMWPVGHACVP